MANLTVTQHQVKHVEKLVLQCVWVHVGSSCWMESAHKPGDPSHQ